jgi:hypothetical protein
VGELAEASLTAAETIVFDHQILEQDDQTTLEIANLLAGFAVRR